MKKRKRREEEAKVEKETNQQLFNFRSVQSTNLSINDQMRDIENGCKILRDLSYQKYGEEEEEEDMRWSFIWKFELSLKEEEEEEITEENEELEEWKSLSIESKLSYLIQILRSNEFRYCLYCVSSFSSLVELNQICPGNLKSDHD